MSPALNGSLVLQRFERSNAVELHNGIMFDFYPGLPQVCLYPPSPPPPSPPPSPPPPPPHTHTHKAEMRAVRSMIISKQTKKGRKRERKIARARAVLKVHVLVCTCLHNQLTTEKKMVCKVTHCTGSLVPRPNFSPIPCVLVEK